MYQDHGLSAARSSGHDNIFWLFVIDNIKLSLREIAKYFLVFFWSDVLFYLFKLFFVEIFVDEQAEVHNKVVIYKA